MTAVVALTKRGTARVLNSREGMLFEVDHFTDSASFGTHALCHVRDYRYPGYDSRGIQTRNNGKPYQTWTLGFGDWEPATLAGGAL